MAKDIYGVDERENPVSEDRASRRRAVNWMIVSLIAFVLIVAAVAALFFLGSARDGEIDTPANLSNR